VTIISRGDALRLGCKFFFTGRPCRRGHVAERYVSAGSCVECVRLPRTVRRTAAPPPARPMIQRHARLDPLDVGAPLCKKCWARLEVSTDPLTGRTFERCHGCGSGRWLSTAKVRSRTEPSIDDRRRRARPTRR